MNAPIIVDFQKLKVAVGNVVDFLEKQEDAEAFNGYLKAATADLSDQGQRLLFEMLNERGLLRTGKGVPYDVVTRLDVTDVAKLLRKQLKETFPGFKFKVTSDRFAGGTSIDVSYSEDFGIVPERKIELNALVDGFKSNRFCGMTDCPNSITSWLSPTGKLVPAYCEAFGMVPEEDHPNPGGWKLVRSGAKFVSVYRGW